MKKITLLLAFVLSIGLSAFAANKPSLSYNFLFTGDGISTTVAIDTALGPIFYESPNANNTLSPLINTIVPSAAHNASCGGLTVSSTALSGVVTKTLTLTFAAAPANGTVYQCGGILDF